ncbi:MAG TPA: zinc ribbon domain-containing protein [Holophaga sp.]|jgi:putative FmdB family regulatory protein|nr:zinc ribbon domain-containing protein [Holophaga sp.]
MPLYEYRCEACGGAEEKLESFSAAMEHDCPKCAATNGMKRQLSTVAFNLAGGGWYAQGYSASGNTATAPAAPATPAPAMGGGCCAGCAHNH